MCLHKSGWASICESVVHCSVCAWVWIVDRRNAWGGLCNRGVEEPSNAWGWTYSTLSFHAPTCRDKRMPPLVYLCLRSTSHQLGSLTETEIKCHSSTRRRISQADPLQDALLCIPLLLTKTKPTAPTAFTRRDCCACVAPREFEWKAVETVTVQNRHL